MKKIFLRVIVLISFSVLVFFLIKTNTNNSIKKEEETPQNEDYSEYLETVRNFTYLDPSSFDKVIANDKIVYIYFGRKTCSYCREFVGELDKLSKKNNVVIYYVDTEKSESSKATELRNTYDIEYVSTLIKFSNGQYKTYDSESMVLDEFLNSK